MPCKHLIAVLTCTEGLSWDSLPESYREFPLFTLDDTIAPFDSSERHTTLVENSDDYDAFELINSHLCNDEQVNESASGKIYDRNVALLRLQSDCRQLLNTVSSYTYKITDVSILEAVIADVKRTVTVCASHVHQTSLTCFHTNRRRKIAIRSHALSYLARRLKLTRSKRKRRKIVKKYRKNAS
jgi:hypothetical protein